MKNIFIKKEAYGTPKWDYSLEYEKEYSFDYNINSNGYRGDEFNQYYPLVVAGCSLTFGIGIPLEGTWGSLLGDMLNLKTANLGIPGRSVETIVMNLIKFIFENKPKYLVCFFPNFERCDVIENDWLTAYNCGYQENLILKPDERIEKTIPIEWAKDNAYRWINLLENICLILNINFIWSTWSLSNLYSLDFSIYKNYIYDETKKDFPDYVQFNTWTEDAVNRKRYFIFENMNCHNDHPLHTSEYFDYGGDTGMRSWKERKGFCPHPGIHRNIHWAEFFFNEIKGRGWV